MTTGERLKRLRKGQGLSADELGTMIGKDRSTIYRYERGEIEKATIDVVPLLARALQTTPQYILGWDKKPAFHWVDPDYLMKLSELAEPWAGWAGNHSWTDEEIKIFSAQAKFIMRIKDTDDYASMMKFITTFYEQLNK